MSSEEQYKISESFHSRLPFVPDSSLFQCPTIRKQKRQNQTRTHLGTGSVTTKMKKYKAGLMKNVEGMRSPHQSFSSRFSCVS